MIEKSIVIMYQLFQNISYNFPSIKISTPKLRVEKLRTEDCPAAIKVAKIWEETALQKSKLAPTDYERTQFANCALTLGLIRLHMKEEEERPEFNSTDENRGVYVCKDRQGNYAAMMLLHAYDDAITIPRLATNPINIRSSVNEDEPNRVQGAGTLLLEAAEEVARRMGKPTISLDPLNTCMEFYLKKGFHFQDPVAEEFYYKHRTEIEISKPGLYSQSFYDKNGAEIDPNKLSFTMLKSIPKISFLRQLYLHFAA